MLQRKNLKYLHLNIDTKEVTLIASDLTALSVSP